MRNFLFLTLFMMGTLPFLAQDRPLNDTEIAHFKNLVNTTSQATQTIQSNFKQYKHLDFLSHEIITEGKMAFKAPNKVKWEYTHPFQYSIIFLEDKLLINDGGSKSDVDLGNSVLFQKLNQLIVNSVKGDLFQDADFEMEFYKDQGRYKIIFTPKDLKIKSYIASFILIFDAQDAHVQEVKMVEPSQDFTRIVFTNRILNTPIPDAVFSH